MSSPAHGEIPRHVLSFCGHPHCPRRPRIGYHVCSRPFRCVPWTPTLSFPGPSWDTHLLVPGTPTLPAGRVTGGGTSARRSHRHHGPAFWTPTLSPRRMTSGASRRARASGARHVARTATLWSGSEGGSGAGGVARWVPWAPVFLGQPQCAPRVRCHGTPAAVGTTLPADWLGGGPFAPASALARNPPPAHFPVVSARTHVHRAAAEGQCRAGPEVRLRYKQRPSPPKRGSRERTGEQKLGLRATKPVNAEGGSNPGATRAPLRGHRLQRRA